MSKKVIPYKESKLGKKEQVTQMFDKVSSNYDFLNRILTFGIDISWREKVVKFVIDHQAKYVLDIATGTGDLAIMLAQVNTDKVVGLDISAGMLEVGKQKVSRLNLDNKIEMILGDSEKLPFADATFDAITVGFGVRNFEDLEQGLGEIYRVLKPNGIFVVLETSQPTKFPMKQGFAFYSKYIIPTIGKMFSKDKSAYQYLPESAAAFPYGEKFNNILLKVGFKTSEVYPQTFGAATIYRAIK
ncbi:MAG: bifunctional demethylmenaquinone methyltransferase/2-methoxy-6-polyprenyl-1,4-benzoquinol methylase UbiE [Flavobacteriaceae bacterium]|nr:bifunctional demethylmenaquinone methyltransferase/2-methoxy-6-polyprenyl-1,4-benzoquinol methylase UbiE [Flavobacteriaceae bacterium]